MRNKEEECMRGEKVMKRLEEEVEEAEKHKIFELEKTRIEVNSPYGKQRRGSEGKYSGEQDGEKLEANVRV